MWLGTAHLFSRTFLRSAFCVARLRFEVLEPFVRYVGFERQDLGIIVRRHAERLHRWWLVTLAVLVGFCWNQDKRFKTEVAELSRAKKILKEMKRFRIL